MRRGVGSASPADASGDNNNAGADGDTPAAVTRWRPCGAKDDDGGGEDVDGGDDRCVCRC